MRLMRCVLLLMVMILGIQPVAADETTSGAAGDSLTIPFKLESSRIIIPSSVNGSRPLSLILDTGMPIEGVYLFHRGLAEEIDMSGAVIVNVGGAGSGEASRAWMIENGVITCGSHAVGGQRIIISQSEMTQGFAADGVIGKSLFGHHTVEVDFEREVIILHDTGAVAVDSTWYAVPITASNEIPFLEGEIEVVPGEVVGVSLYVDLASGEAIELLTGPEQKYTLPDSLEEGYLGTGLSGDISGYRGRVLKVRVGPYELANVQAVFAPAEVRSKQKGSDGILGCGFMMRFNVIFDYVHGFLYIKPSHYYGDPFRQAVDGPQDEAAAGH